MTRGGFLRSPQFNRFVLGIDSILSRMENILSMFLFALMTISVLMNVILRYVFKIPNLYGEEIARYAFILVVYMGCSICVKENSHLGVEVFVQKFSPKARAFWGAFVDLVLTFTYAFLVYLFVQFSMRSIRIFQVTPAMRIPFAWLHFTIAFCFGICLIRSLMLLWDKYISETHPLRKGNMEVDL